MPENAQVTLRGEADSKDAHQQQLHNFLSLLPKFELKIPFLYRLLKPKGESDVKVESVDAQNEEKSQKPDVVRLPNAQLTVPPPLELEVEETGRTSNPVILWQVYAIGGFFVLKWVWARWNERKERAKKGSSDDNQPREDDPSPENYQSAADDEP
ncbi:hypothetical protein HS088_TW09G00623 [Tripterygium wilfordii]|uniref:Uncharacterized protein n=1 Tax=Tripterygium wilfordii TaxID=458696 RepID=A0A7J7D8B2_TRIWF|nr:uncharacterized protein LOC120005090 [Tripterygium wilfordii]KAF5742572.1 hypothetical protein HS088_TW09G00623 [Tripterygium wilfordii]